MVIESAEKKEKPDRLQKLSDRHHEIARLAALGWSNRAIAEQLQMSPNTISMLRNNSTLMQGKVRALSEQRDISVSDIRESIERLVPTALEALERITENVDGSVHDATQLKAASHILGIMGVAPVQQSKHVVVTAALPPSKVSELVKRLQSNQSRLEIGMEAAV